VTPYTMILASLKASLGVRIARVMGPQKRPAWVGDPAGRPDRPERRVGGP
jgi:hypothetical protein